MNKTYFRVMKPYRQFLVSANQFQLVYLRLSSYLIQMKQQWQIILLNLSVKMLLKAEKLFGIEYRSRPCNAMVGLSDL